MADILLRSGTSTLEITPPFPMPMGGYGARVDCSDGAHDPLMLTAVYFETEGREAWIVAADIIQFPNGSALSEGKARVAEVLKCPESALFLNASHTHGGPEVLAGVEIPSPLMRVQRSPENQERILKYLDYLWERTATACDQARKNAVAARIVYGEGTSRFSMNRRLEVKGRVENAPNLDGPHEDRIRLIGVEDATGELMALGLVLAAHPTSTGSQHLFTADYVGAWRERFRRRFGNKTTPFFLQACAGDLRPTFTRQGDHWRRVALDELPKMGENLCDETCEVLSKGLKPLGEGLITHASSIVEVPCERVYTTPEACKPLLESAIPWEVEFAEECIRRLRAGEPIQSSVSMNIQLLNIAPGFMLVGLGCEPLYGLGRKIEAAFPGVDSVVLGYTNGCFGYLPDSAELLRGGYEAEAHFFETPLSGPLAPGVEELVIAGLKNLYLKTGGSSG